MKKKPKPTIADLRAMLWIIVGNAKLIRDHTMNGTTDIYAVPIDDIEAAKKLLDQLKG